MTGARLKDLPRDIAEPVPRRWTREEFERAIDAGLFGPEERLELIGGEIVRRMTPQKSPHATAISLVEEAVRTWFPTGYPVRVQLPLAIDPDSEPEPDCAVVSGSIRDYERSHPSTAILVIEISDTTLRFDRTIKASLYASAGIPEYWVVNLLDRVIECYREPAAAADQRFGYMYRNVTRHHDGETIAPAGHHRVPVADLLPRQVS